MSPLHKLYTLILTLNPFEFAALSVVLGYLFTDGLDTTQIEALGNFFESVGQIMLTIGAQAQVLEENGKQQNNFDEAICILKNKIGNIEEFLENLKNLNL